METLTVRDILLPLIAGIRGCSMAEAARYLPVDLVDEGVEDDGDGAPSDGSREVGQERVEGFGVDSDPSVGESVSLLRDPFKPLALIDSERGLDRRLDTWRPVDEPLSQLRFRVPAGVVHGPHGSTGGAS